MTPRKMSKEKYAELSGKLRKRELFASRLGMVLPPWNVFWWALGFTGAIVGAVLRILSLGFLENKTVFTSWYAWAFAIMLPGVVHAIIAGTTLQRRVQETSGVCYGRSQFTAST